LQANHRVRAIGISGDGDTGSIGLGQFKHMVRRNVRMAYVVENNGVYGLTKGQFSATAEHGQDLKYAGHNDFPPIDVAVEAIVAGAGFVARSFAGDAKQVRELLKAAMSFRGLAVLDIISPCVAFNDEDDSRKSYAWGRANERALQELGYVAPQDEIFIEDYDPGTTSVVELHDGSRLTLRKLEAEYEPNDRLRALERLRRGEENGELVTGLLYYDDSRPSLAAVSGFGQTPLSQLPAGSLRPGPEALCSFLASYA